MIGIITYDFPHKKTQDLITQLLIKGHKDLLVMATPYVERKNHVALYLHRPNKAIDISLTELCENLKINCLKCDVSDLPKHFKDNNFDHVLIAGAGILPEEIVKGYKIINSHPGYLPNVKGLDALKWAIYNDQPIGVTTHYISEKTDEGLLIERRLVPIFFEDSFHSVAYRQYEMEIEMMVNSLEIIKNSNLNEELADDQYQPNRRMPHHLERIMINRFQRILEKSPSFIQK